MQGDFENDPLMDDLRKTAADIATTRRGQKFRDNLAKLARLRGKARELEYNMSKVDQAILESERDVFATENRRVK